MPILQWLNRDESIAAAGKAAYRILEEDPGLSYGDDSQNLLVHCDNLEAPKALLPYYAGQVKCIYMDPPINMTKLFCSRHFFLSGLPLCTHNSSPISISRPVPDTT